MFPEHDAQFSSVLPHTYLRLSDDLRAITLEIYENTIHYTRNSPFMNNNGMVMFARQIAKDLDRPYVPRGTNWIDIPLKKYLDPVHAPLRLCAVERNGRHHGNHPISFMKNTVYARYHFFTDEAFEVFQSFLKRTQEDPDMRKALKLPPK